MKVDLSNGQHAMLRGPETVRNRERRQARRATDKVDGQATKDIVFMDTIIGQLLESWSFDLPLPSEAKDPAEVFDEIDPGDYDLLVDAALAIHKEAREGVKTEPNPDPDSPTPPLGD